MNINGTTKIYGLIGNPVAHTLSPLLHNSLARKMGHNLVYGAFPVLMNKVGETVGGAYANAYTNNLEMAIQGACANANVNTLEMAIRGAHALGFGGLNVTVPYKSDVIPFLKAIDPVATRIGAVNTLVRTEDGFVGFNTDNIGLWRTMVSEDILIKDKEIVILGAGGAARAAALLCAEENAKRIFILNRTTSKAKDLADKINETLTTDILIGMGMDEINKLPETGLIVIQSTSVGMYPHVNEVLINDDDFYVRIEAGIDMIYNPAETLFMKKIKNNGGKAVNGLKMLFYQGIAAYELWNKVTVPEEYAEFVYQELEKALTEAVN